MIGTIGLTALYVILAAGYFGITYTKESWELGVMFAAAVALLILGVLGVSKFEMLVMVSRIRSGKIGKNLLDSKKIARKVKDLRKTLTEGGDREKIHDDLRESLTAEFKEAAEGYGLDYMIELIARGADFKGPYEYERTPLMMINGWTEAGQKAAVLLKLGAGVNACDEDRMTPLMNAAYTKIPDLIHCLLAAGADTQARDSEVKTALMYLVRGAGGMKMTRKSLVTLCLVSDVNAQDNEGKTPLMHAASGNRYSEAAELIKRGADLDIKNSKGHTALDWAEIERADKDLVKLLKRAEL